jgi:hypothetical protein
MDELHKERIERYLRTNLGKGYSEDSLKWALIKQGNSRTEVTRALTKVKKEMSEKKGKNEKPEIRYELYDQDNRPVDGKSLWKRFLDWIGG